MGNLAGHPILTTSRLLIASNAFMTFAWYAHLKNLSGKPLRRNYLWAGLYLMGVVYFNFAS